MIISKKKFEKLVDEEVIKRLHEVEEKRKIAEQRDRLEQMIRLTDCQVQVLRDELEELKRAILRSKCNVR